MKRLAAGCFGALALALALSRQVTALSTGGAAKLEAIFLDEGFGIAWQALGEGQPEVLLLLVWQPGQQPPPVPRQEGWDLLAEGRIEARG